MFYLYHRLPNKMQGTILYPLNSLRDVFPDAYAAEVKKYSGREHLLKRRIPVLDCLWNDVLHFSSVSPKDVMEALRRSGMSVPSGIRYYQIDPFSLDKSRTIVYLPKETPDESEFVEYDPDDIHKYSVLSSETKDYYKEEISCGRKPLVYRGVPHILYKGNLDMVNVKILGIA